MFTTLLLAVTEASEAAGHAAGEAGIVEKFGLDPKSIVIQLISFLILFGVLYYKGIKPTTDAMAERSAKIDQSLKDADAIKAKLEAASAESAGIVKQAQADATKIIEEARASAKEFLDRQAQEAVAQAQDIVTKARHVTELEHRKMIAEARGEIARLVVSTTRQVLAKELSDADRSRFNDAAAKELTIA